MPITLRRTSEFRTPPPEPDARAARHVRPGKSCVDGVRAVLAWLRRRKRPASYHEIARAFPTRGVASLLLRMSDAGLIDVLDFDFYVPRPQPVKGAAP